MFRFCCARRIGRKSTCGSVEARISFENGRTIMSLPVDIHSLEPIRDVRAAYGRFAEDARNALAATEMEINRIMGWLTNDRRLHWQSEIRRQRDQLAQAKAELFRKRTAQVLGTEANLSEPRDYVREARARLEHAEKMLERVRKWLGPLQQAIHQYRAAAQPLADSLDGDVARTLARLERMITALEQYAAESAAVRSEPPEARSEAQTEEG